MSSFFLGEVFNEIQFPGWPSPLQQEYHKAAVGSDNDVAKLVLLKGTGAIVVLLGEWT